MFRNVRYRATRPDDRASRERLKALAQERRRFGYRRLQVLLRGQGHAVNKKRVQRLSNEVRPHSALGNEVPAALHRAPREPSQLGAR